MLIYIDKDLVPYLKDDAVYYTEMTKHTVPYPYTSVLHYTYEPVDETMFSCEIDMSDPEYITMKGPCLCRKEDHLYCECKDEFHCGCICFCERSIGKYCYMCFVNR